MKRRYIAMIVALVVGLLASDGGYAQSRKDSRAYQAAVKKNDKAGLQKYLSKFPDGYYASEVMTRLDSIEYHALEDNVASLVLYLASKPDTRYASDIFDRILVSEHYAGNENLTEVHLIDSLTQISIDSDTYWFYSYENRAEGEASRREYVANLINPRTGLHTAAMFEGKLYIQGDTYRIEGSSPDRLGLQVLPTRELQYLLKHFETVPFLVVMSEEDLDAEKCLDIWIDKNSKVKKGGKVEFITMPPACTLAQMTRETKAKDSKDGIAIYLLEWKGYSIVASYNSKTKFYRILWAEPSSSDRKKDRYITSLYFENPTQIVLYYYQGRTSFKNRLNLSSGKLQ